MGKGVRHTFSLPLIPRQWGEEKESQTVLPSHIHKDALAPPSSSSKAAPAGGRGGAVGEDSAPCSGFPPPALSLPALGRCPLRAHRLRTEPGTAASSEPAQKAESTASSVSAGTALHTSSSQNKPETPSTPSPPKQLFIPFNLETTTIEQANC